LIGDDDNNNGGGMGKEKIYNSRKEELVLASLSELYSELNAISVDTSSTFLVCFTPFTNYLDNLLLL